MKNFVQPGDDVTVAAPYDVLSGAGALVGSLFGVAAYDALSGADVVLHTCGVFDLKKVSAQAWTVGAKIYWDNSAKNATTTSTGNTLIGVALKAADNPSSTGYVRLNQGALFDDGLPISVEMEAAAGAANVTEVTMTVKDAAGNTVAAVHHMDVWLSDDADGEGLTGTSASGTVTAKAASGVVLSTYTAKKALRVQSLKTGVFILEITDTGKTAFKVCASLNGKAVVGMTLATGDYGA
jgi:predicted RecA/RadA family phage recombinase